MSILTTGLKSIIKTFMVIIPIWADVPTPVVF